MAWTPIESLLPAPRTITHNILRTYEAATPIEAARGHEWYDLAHLFADKISHGEIKKGAGVIAALSPQKDWLENMYLAQRAFEDGRASGHMGAFVKKADRILDGEEPLDVLGGNKVRAFYKLILDPTNAHDVCIDRHAFDIAVGEVTDDKARKVLERARGYDLIANLYRQVAKKVEVLPSQLQATTWVSWRKAKSKKVMAW